jgi:hypothetical protein
MARKGLPSQYAKMGFKKGWKAFRAAHGHSPSKSHKRGSRSFSFGGDFTAPAINRAPLKRLSSITPSKIMSPLIDLALTIIGMAIGATVKKMVPIKNPHLMNGVQAVVGVGGSLFTKNRFMKFPLLGIALQSSVAEAKLLFPKMVPLAGDDEVVYLPAGPENQQLEFQGDAERFAGVVDGDAERFAGVVDGEEEEGELLGEGHDA